ncbi:hypothetical protein KGF54_001405 [Candida jiufengensis]|uniref:uncharacterized protein n=1 Tax=Candida jiufengensis TaxID=497108 RepID=UPI002225B16C|nr:uncharacterized protein KGF54_001405 [Candida jiufengensis]KAI5955903.1 hypothetical protein KGF54_001405 [Candida jiufengensis]
MPDESPVKRKIELEELNENLKRTKSVNHEDLKSIVIHEIKKLFEDRISRLESRVKYLEDELDLKEENEPKDSDLINDDDNENHVSNDKFNDKEVEGENDIDVDISRDDDNENKGSLNNSNQITNPPALPPRAQFGGGNTFQFKANSSTIQSNETKKIPSSNKPVFGATTTFGNMNKTPSISDTTTSKLESKQVPISSKPVFGATTSFGNMNKNNSKDSTEDNNNSKSSTPTASIGGFSTFGSKSRFGNAFQESIKQKSFLDSAPSSSSSTSSTKKDKSKKEGGLDEEGEEEDEEEESGKSQNKDALPTSTATQQFKQVDLNPVEQTTGEEDEKSIFNCTAKLFELKLTSIEEGWKERGIGPLHLNQSTITQNQIRLVMRSQGLLKVILNYKIQKDTEILKGLEASLNPGKYLRLNSISDGKPIQYLLKFSNERIRDELIDNIEQLQNEI